MFSHLRAHAFARSVTVARSSAVQASSSRRQERRWAIVCGSPPVAVHRLGVVETICVKVVVELEILESGRARDVHASNVGPTLKLNMIIYELFLSCTDVKFNPVDQECMPLSSCQWTTP